LKSTVLGRRRVTPTVTCLNQSPYESHRDFTLFTLLHVVPQAAYKLRLEYDDGTIGDVDVSDLICKGVF